MWIIRRYVVSDGWKTRGKITKPLEACWNRRIRNSYNEFIPNSMGFSQSLSRVRLVVVSPGKNQISPRYRLIEMSGKSAKLHVLI